MSAGNDLNVDVLLEQIDHIKHGWQESPLPLWMQMGFHFIKENDQAIRRFEIRQLNRFIVLVPGPDQQVGKRQYPSHAGRQMRYRYHAVR